MMFFVIRGNMQVLSVLSILCNVFSLTCIIAF